MTSSGPHSLPPMSLPYPPGTVLAGKYRVERLLGKGGMGWVVVATHLQLEQRVALKFMHADHAGEHPDAVARFIREARAAARIQSEHVARVFDVGTLENGVALPRHGVPRGAATSRRCVRRASSCRVAGRELRARRRARGSPRRTPRASCTATSSPPTCSSRGAPTARCA